MRLLRHDLVRRSALFAISVVASTLVGVISIPLLVSSVGAGEWALLAVMQSVCQIAAVLVALGWGATGPSMVSAVPTSERKSMYLESLELRGLAFIVLAPAAVAAAVVLTGNSVWTASLAVLTYVTPGLYAGWYLIGTNRPVALFAFDALPSILGQVAGLIAIAVTGDLDAYLLCTATFGVGAALVSALFVLTRKSDGPARRGRRDWAGTLASQLPGVTTSLAGSLWSTIPTILVQAIAPAVLPVFALVDRFLKYGIIALAPILQAIQGWIPEAGPSHLRSRAKASVWVAAGVGGLGGLALALLASPASAVLTLGQAVVPVGIGVLAGLAFAFDAVAQITGLATLVALGARSQLAVSSLILLGIGLPLVALLTFTGGLGGAVSALCAAAGIVAAYRVGVAVRMLRRGTPEGAGDVLA